MACKANSRALPYGKYDVVLLFNIQPYYHLEMFESLKVYGVLTFFGVPFNCRIVQILPTYIVTIPDLQVLSIFIVYGIF